MPHSPPVPKLRSDPALDELRPWYHDFSALGLDTGAVPAGASARIAARLAQLCAGAVPGSLGRRLYRRASALRSKAHRANQHQKEAVLVPLLEESLADLGAEPSCLDLFCSDGYYSCVTAKARPDARVLGVDMDDDNIHRARVAGRLLGLNGLRFIREDVRSFVSRSSERFNLVLCAGGLYHLDNPRELLADLERVCSKSLVLQTVVSLDDESADYFESPAPGWSHGCRFSHARLLGWLDELGWQVRTTRRNELPGNRRARDRGSSYVLCEAPPR